MTEHLKPCPCDGNLNYQKHTPDCLDQQATEKAKFGPRTRAADPRGDDAFSREEELSYRLESVKEYAEQYDELLHEAVLLAKHLTNLKVLPGMEDDWAWAFLERAAALKIGG